MLKNIYHRLAALYNSIIVLINVLYYTLTLNLPLMTSKNRGGYIITMGMDVNVGMKYHMHIMTLRHKLQY